MQILSAYREIDTPALLVDADIVSENIQWMQRRADSFGVALRPHTKTHKMPKIAAMQLQAGARGITVAKTGEAEVMAEAGINDIFIANEIVGHEKLVRLRELHRKVRLIVGVDCVEQVEQLEEVFAGESKKLQLRMEIEVGEDRSGVISEQAAVQLARRIRGSQVLELEGIFCHEGHCYKARSHEQLNELCREAQLKMLSFAGALRDDGEALPTVSIGSTPSMLCCDILPGITEIRPGTYVFMDAAQGALTGDYSRCAATVLTTVISRPTDERVILDAGAKALTAQERGAGLCHTPGKGLIKGSDRRLSGVFDEHGIILDRELREMLAVGDKIEIIPNHICPCVNLYDRACLVSDGKLLEELPILARGKIK